MRYVRGFLMAWGCFCWIPCPYKKWREEDRPAMLAMLPLVGTFMGAIVSLLWWSLITFEMDPLLTAAIVVGVYYLLTGFIHLDGYMDCCDAVLPRHPDMDRRREILKDPHSGSFAVIGLVLMLIIVLASVYTLASAAMDGKGDITWIVMVIFPAIMTVSRGMSVLDVMREKPMETSQYAKMAEGSSEHAAGTRSVKAARGVAVVIFLLSILAVVVIEFMLYFYPRLLGEDVPVGIGMIVPITGTFVVAMLLGRYDRKVLGGMNGDISGHMIVAGEAFGLLMAALSI